MSRLVLLAVMLLVTPADAVTSSQSIGSKFSANGHNVSFDGRLFLARTSEGWVAYVLRPEALTYRPDGLPAASGAMWSDPKAIIGDPEIPENALAICEPDHSRAPYRCDADGAATATGIYDCYDVWLIDSDAAHDFPAGGLVMRRRRVTLWIARPRTREAFLFKHRWEGGIEPLTTTAAGSLSGIEPTVTRDGKLMVWNGIHELDRAREELLYSTNPTPCAASGWSPPQPLSHMINDPTVNGVYRLGERPLRATDGTSLADGEPLPGAYPWLFPDGEAVIFISTNLPCRAEEDPPGCGPRRQMVTVIGYPTNWGVAPIDGAVNPDTDQTARLFFSSPGPKTFPGLPTTPGKDVWPFFGSNTENYVELSFDDGLDGDYAGLWHMNEGVRGGGLDPAQAPDVSGYFNTARAAIPLPARNLLGGPRSYTGTAAADTLPNDASLSPTDHITVELSVTPTASLDCNAGDNARFLLSKGNPGGGPFFMTITDDNHVHARFVVQGGAEYWVSSAVAIPRGSATRVAASYDATSGKASMFIDGALSRVESYPPLPLSTSTEVVYVGGTPWVPEACPTTGGSFIGTLDGFDVSTRVYTNGISRASTNDGVLGRSVALDGSFGHFEVAHAASLSPVNALTLEMALRPASDPDCDDKNNFRVLLEKRDGYSLVLEEGRRFHGRVSVQGGAVYEIVSPEVLPLDAWSRIGMTYDGATGELVAYVDGAVTARVSNPPAPLLPASGTLLIGGPATPRGACPDGGGGFHGSIDEVAISRIARDLSAPPPVPTPPPDAGTDPGEMTDGGGCAVGGGTMSLVPLALLALLLVCSRRR